MNCKFMEEKILKERNWNYLNRLIENFGKVRNNLIDLDLGEENCFT